MLASAIGVALSAGSAAHLAQAAENTEPTGERNPISLGATNITGQEQDNTSSRENRPGMCSNMRQYLRSERRQWY